MTEQYCVARHNDFCPIENCKSHIILISDSVEDILEKLDNYFYTYQTVGCLYTLFKHQFYNTLVVRKGNVFNQLVTAIKHNSDLKCVEKNAKFCQEKDSRERGSNNIFWDLGNKVYQHRLLDLFLWIEYILSETLYMKRTF